MSARQDLRFMYSAEIDGLYDVASFGTQMAYRFSN